MPDLAIIWDKYRQAVENFIDKKYSPDTVPLSPPLSRVPPFRWRVCMHVRNESNDY